MKYNIYKIMDFTQGSLMNVLPKRWEEIALKIEEAKKLGQTEISIHKQYYPLDWCHKKLKLRLDSWLQDKNQELYAKIYDDNIQGCFMATNPEVFVAWT